MTNRLRNCSITTSSFCATLLLILTLQQQQQQQQISIVQICDAATPNPTIVAGASYAVYSFVIDKYAARVVKKMKGVPTPEDIRSRSRSRLSTDTEVEAEAEIQMSKMATPSHLRTTVSKRTNVVTKYEDRLLWNQWIASEKAATMDKSSPTAAATTTAAAAIGFDAW
mmetsp:Transcript_18501/g.27764  ORF Transcript_18501/g.27764 Transcript_18501/m.27764 type:complete len:168 (-) Transcript_18501:76-579(-)